MNGGAGSANPPQDRLLRRRKGRAIGGRDRIKGLFAASNPP